jgi:hypothetical protein
MASITPGTYPEIKDEEFNTDIFLKKEFYDADADDTLAKHQKIVQRYASPFTNFNEVLLFHAMGTGKTRSALSIAENALNTVDENKGVYVGRSYNVMGGRAEIKQILPNDKVEIEIYRPRSRETTTLEVPSSTVPRPAQLRRVIVVGRNKEHPQSVFTNELKKMGVKDDAYIKSNYKFMSFGDLAKALNAMDLTKAIEVFDNSIFILDEVHHLLTDVSSAKQRELQNINLLFQTLPNRKVILLSGTPMVNSPKDIVPIVNLMLPKSEMLKWNPNIDEFKKQLAEKVKGRVSYLKEETGGGRTPAMIEKGDLRAPMEYFKLEYVEMSPFQTEAYNKQPRGDFERERRDASMFVFPDGSVGRDGASAWTSNGNLTLAFKKLITTGGRLDLQKLKKYSCKFARALQYINKGPWPIYIYSNLILGDADQIKGGGLRLFSQLLKMSGMKPFTGGSAQNSYIYFTSRTVPSASILAAFNSPENKDGRLCKVILGSEASSEGYTFRNIKAEVILTPHDNYTETAQAIARGIRVNSHDTNDTSVEVARLAAVPSDGTIGVDQEMYRRSEIKDVKIKDIEHVLKENAFDCAFNYDQNKREDREDNSRDCDYKECKYTCEGIDDEYLDEGGYYADPDELDVSTWDLYYAPKSPLINDIKNIFDVQNKITLSDLHSRLGKDLYSENLLLVVLDDLIDRRVEITQRKGVSCYLNHFDNIIFLTFDFVQTVGSLSLTETEYLDNPVITVDKTQISIFEKETNSDLRKLLSNPLVLFSVDIASTQKKVACPTIASLPLTDQEYFIEAALVFLESPQAAEAGVQYQVAKQVEEYYKAAIVKEDNLTFSSLLFSFDKGPLRVKTAGGSWRDANENEQESYVKVYGSGEKMGSLVSNLKQENKIYGLYNVDTACKFCLKMPTGVRKRGAAGEKIGRDACTFSQVEIIKHLLDMRVNPSTENLRKLCGKSEINISIPPHSDVTASNLRSRLNSKQQKVLDKLLKMKKVDGSPSGQTLATSRWEEWYDENPDQLAKAMFIYIQKNKSYLVAVLFNFFESDDRLFLDKNCGSSQKARLAQLEKV